MKLVDILKLKPVDVRACVGIDGVNSSWPNLDRFFENIRVDDELSVNPALMADLATRGLQVRTYWSCSRYTDWGVAMSLNVLFYWEEPVVAEAHYEHGEHRWVLDQVLYRDLVQIIHSHDRVSDVVKLEDVTIDGVFDLQYAVEDGRLIASPRKWTKDDLIEWLQRYEPSLLASNTAAELVALVDSCWRETDYRRGMLKEDDVRFLAAPEPMSERDFHRSLVRFESVDKVTGEIKAVVPSWNPDAVVTIDPEAIAPELRALLGRSPYLFAQVNLGAKTATDLVFKDFEDAEPTIRSRRYGHLA